MALDRRAMLRWAACGAAASGLRIALAAPEQAPARLVLVLLRGGMDGLSLVVPHGDAGYYANRSTIALARPGQPEGVLPLDKLFGLHPAAAALMPWWENKQLAFVHASGSADPSRSHFDAQDYMETGTPGRKGTPDGWMNRLASALAPSAANAQARRMMTVGLGPTLPRILQGTAEAASMETGPGAAKAAATDPRAIAAFAALYGSTDPLGRTMQQLTTSRREMQAALASDDPKADAGALSLAALARDTHRLGRLMAADARVRLAFVPVAGWDTHASQGAAHGLLANRFGLLAAGLDALAQGLGDRLRETTVVVLSEFGRTVKQNGNGATDHGHGNVALLLGAGVRGGKVHGEWPGLETASLYEGRDLAVTTDFRALLAEILEQRFRLGDRALASVLPEAPRQRIRAVA
ncbi:DUF1501 domain-containing protein [Ramlibacter alkalitolerans]|uniref:DUF1501 domain-containing protein n=1 Tax=Ramlibacter alkalitolerans TaxID=2039631 RepID=UPI001F2F0BA3|nr:DUF1501 domain-containing protein [Ramlibacter alkalitolerans]